MRATTSDDGDACFARWMTMLAHHRRTNDTTSSASGASGSGSDGSDDDAPQRNTSSAACSSQDFASCAFIDLPMVGTHDSATHGICDSSDFAPDAPRGLGRLPRAIVPLVRRIVAQWSKTQSVGILQQLRAGVRYFDIRLVPRRCHSTGLEELWVSHGSYSVPFASVVHEVAIFYAGVLSTDPDAVAANLETIVLDVQRVTGFTAAHTAMFIQAIAPLRALLCDERWHVSTPLREVWDAQTDAPRDDRTCAGALSNSDSRLHCGGSDRWSIDSWSRDVSSSQNHGAAGHPLSSHDSTTDNVARTPQQQLGSSTYSEQPQSPAWAMSPRGLELSPRGMSTYASPTHDNEAPASPSGAPLPFAVAAGEVSTADTPTRRLGQARCSDGSPRTSGPVEVQGSGVHSRIASTGGWSVHSHPADQDNDVSAFPRASPAAAAAPRPTSCGGVSQRRIFLLYPAAAIAQSLAVLTPEDRSILHDRHTMAIRSLWFNQQEVTPLLGKLQRELIMSGAAPCERSATLHALQAVLTPTPRDIAWSVVVTLPVRSIQDYAEQLNTKVLALWHGFSRLSKWAPRGEALSVQEVSTMDVDLTAVGPHGGATAAAETQHSQQSGGVFLRDRRNVLLMDFFEVGRAPNGATAVELCFQDAITRFLPELRFPVPARALALGYDSPMPAADVMRWLSDRMKQGRNGRPRVNVTSSLSVEAVPATAVPLLLSASPGTRGDGATAEAVARATLAPMAPTTTPTAAANAATASPVIGVAHPVAFAAVENNAESGKPIESRGFVAPNAAVEGFTANHHRLHTAAPRPAGAGVVRRLWSGTKSTLWWMVVGANSPNRGHGPTETVTSAPGGVVGVSAASVTVVGSAMCTSSASPPPPPSAW